MDEQFTKDLMQAKSPEDFLHVIDLAEADKEEKEEAKAEAEKQRSERRLLWLRLPDVLPESHILIWSRSLRKAAAERMPDQGRDQRIRREPRM